MPIRLCCADPASPPVVPSRDCKPSRRAGCSRCCKTGPALVPKLMCSMRDRSWIWNSLNSHALPVSPSHSPTAPVDVNLPREAPRLRVRQYLQRAAVFSLQINSAQTLTGFFFFKSLLNVPLFLRGRKVAAGQGDTNEFYILRGRTLPKYKIFQRQPQVVCETGVWLVAHSASFTLWHIARKLDSKWDCTVMNSFLELHRAFQKHTAWEHVD